MTEAELKGYRALCKKISDLEGRIKQEQERPVDVVAGKVKGSMREFPYVEVRVGVEMEDPTAAETRDRLIWLYQKAKEQAEQKKLEIEQFIEHIPDPELQMVFRYRYIDGKKLMDIGEEIGMDRSGVGKKIRGYLKLSHNSPF